MKILFSALPSSMKVFVGLSGAIVFAVAVFAAFEMGSRNAAQMQRDVVVAMRASSQLTTLMGMVSDAEANQRGFLLTDREDYLETYNQIVPKINPLSLELLDAYISLGNRPILEEYRNFRITLSEKLSEMELTLHLAQEGKKPIAQELVLFGFGKEKADLLRDRARLLQSGNNARISEAIEHGHANLNKLRVAVGLVAILNILMLAVFAQWLRRDIRSRDEKQDDLEQQQVLLGNLVVERAQELEILASHLQTVSEREKARIARELHDDLGALLTASKMDVSWVRQHLTAEQTELGEKLDRAMQNLNQCVQAKRRVIENLVPSTLATFGLVIALKEFLTAMEDAAGWALELDLPIDNLVISDDVAIALYRIVQESINNIAKYAGAKTVWVRARTYLDTISLEIEDDGVGFNSAEMRPNSHGLAGMRQRMVGLRGTLKVDSQVGHGTRICARVSLNAVAL